MNEPHPRVRKAPQVLKPLATCLALALAAGQPAGAAPATASASAVAVPAALRLQLRDRMAHRTDQARSIAHRVATTRPAATRAVTSCADDGGPGTLRSAIADAVSGDLIDLSALTCSTITLTQGSIITDVDDLALRGPEGGLSIDGGGTDSILVHYGEGTLSIEQLTIANGYYEGGGGCLFSNRNIVLNTATVTGCGTSSSYGAGAGVLARGDLTIESSTVSDNSGALAGGGVAADGHLSITNSTISGNSAAVWGGGIYATGEVTILNSTISDNRAEVGGGGIFIAYDRPTTMQSSIIAGNSAGDDADYAPDLGAGYPMTIVGSNNLVVSSDATLPVGTLDVDPLLLPLADNGGPTRTHALGEGSPGIDAGNNSGNLAFDQRGSGFPRVVGAAADIGAFEVRTETPDDTIFKDGFDG